MPLFLLLLPDAAPANLGDLLALRLQELHAPAQEPAPGAPRLEGAWERWRNGVMHLAARFESHLCRGQDCAKCAEVYVTLQVLDARQQHLLATQHARRLRQLWPQPDPSAP